jgi:hypothetical protein
MRARRLERAADLRRAVADAGTPVPDAEVLATADAAVELEGGAGIAIPETVEVLIGGTTPHSRSGRTAEAVDGPDNLPIAVGESRKITTGARFADMITVASDAKGRGSSSTSSLGSPV